MYEREGARILAGKYVRDKLEGNCEITTNEGGVLEMTFVRGVANGPARRFSPSGFMQWVGRYRSGLPHGICWHSSDGEGWYVGTSNRCGRMTGDEVVYLYPGKPKSASYNHSKINLVYLDFHTVLVGTWDNDVMRSGVLSKTVGITSREGYVYPLTVVQNIERVYRTDVSGYSVISLTPRDPDPYEALMVRCDVSTVPGGGEGLFAEKDIPAGTVVSFYNGIRFHDCHVTIAI